MKTLVALLLMSGTVFAQASRVPVPKLKDVLADDMVAKARIRWSKVVEGERVDATVQGGEAFRMNKHAAPEPLKLTYDLTKNRELVKLIKAAKLGSPNRVSSVATDRSLEILAEGPKDWVVVGAWSMPAKKWEKSFPELYEHLEHLMTMQTDLFQPMKTPER
jgi:hypothetical protein